MLTRAARSALNTRSKINSEVRVARRPVSTRVTVQPKGANKRESAREGTRICSHQMILVMWNLYDVFAECPDASGGLTRKDGDTRHRKSTKIPGSNVDYS